MRRDAKRHTETLTEVQEYLVSHLHSLFVTAIFLALHISGLFDRVASRKPFFKEMTKNVLKSRETKVEDFGHHFKRNVWNKTKKVSQTNNTIYH